MSSMYLRQCNLTSTMFVCGSLLRTFVRRLSHARRTSPGALSYLSVPGESPLMGLTIGQLVDAASCKYGDKEAIYVAHQNIRKTFSQAQKETDELAEGFIALGLEKGDRVGIWSPNCYEWFLTHHAVAKAGLVLVSINPAYQSREILYAINLVGIKCLIISSPFKTQNYYDILNAVAPEVNGSEPGKINSKAAPSLKMVVTMEPSPLKGTFSFEEIHFRGTKGTHTKTLAQMDGSIQFDDLFNIQFTSGTTGQPKGVMLSHHSLVNNSLYFSKRMELTAQDKICLTVPLFHCYGACGGIMSSIHTGAGLVFPAPNFDPLKSLQAMDSEKCSVMYGTPTMHVDMTSHPDLAKYDVSSLRIVATAGAYTPEALCLEMKTKYKIPGIANVYGMTETSPVSFQSLSDDSDDLRHNTVGYPMEHVEVKIVDTAGRIVPIGVEGEMCVRGYLTMLGYWEDKTKTEQVVKKSRWLHTGDNMIMFPNGYARVVGRLTDMVIRGGENIYPREIEEFLHTNPSIVEAHVFGVGDERMGEELAVWVRLKDGTQMTPKELKDFCKGQISHFKIPRYVSFRSDFPKTTSGKIQKFRMREIEEKEIHKSP